MRKLFMVLVLLLASNIFAQQKGFDHNLTQRYAHLTVSGHWITSSFLLEVARGNVPGHSIMSKFGQNSALNISTYEDIWDAGGDYPYPPSASITHIDSDNAADTEPIEVQGLDVDGDYSLDTDTATGTTPVVLNTALWRCFRLRNVGDEDLVGNVQAINAADDSIFAQIQNGNNQTLMALYTIPDSVNGYLIRGTNSLADDKTATVQGKLWMREYGSVFQLKKTFGLMSTGTSFIPMEVPYNRIKAKTDIRVSAISDAAGAAVNTTFEILLIEYGY